MPSGRAPLWNPRWSLPNADQPLPKLLVDTLRAEAMTPAQKQTVEENLHKLPEAYQAAIGASLLMPPMPYNLFFVSLENGAYREHNQMMGRLLHQREKLLLNAMIMQDLAQLRSRKEITARQARTYYFLKYGMSNKVVLEAMGYPTMREALGLPPANPQTDKSSAQLTLLGCS